MSYQSLVHGLEINDPKLDRKNSECFERYHIGKKAIYVDGFFSDEYIPYAAIRRVWFQASQHNTVGTCGMGLKVFVVCVGYDNGFGEEQIQKFMLEDCNEANAMVISIKLKSQNLI